MSPHAEDGNESQNEDKSTGENLLLATRTSARIRSRGKKKRFAIDLSDGSEDEDDTRKAAVERRKKNKKKRTRPSNTTWEENKPRESLTSSKQKPSTRQSDGSATIKTVTNQDVLKGRGNGVNNLPGNIRFRKIVAQYHIPYMNAPHAHKRSVMEKVRDIVTENGGQFLEVIGDGLFMPLPETRVFEKISQALRESKAGREKAASTRINGPMNHSEVVGMGVSSTRKPHLVSPSPTRTGSRDITTKGSEVQQQAFQFKHLLLMNHDVNDDEENNQKIDEKVNNSPSPMPATLSRTGSEEKPFSKSFPNHHALASQKKYSDGVEGSSFDEKDIPLAGKYVSENGMTQKDILFGRGQPINTHPGNIIFRKYIHERRETYCNLSTVAKRPFALAVYDHFGGRFWEIVPGLRRSSELTFRKVEEARSVEKIAQALREKSSLFAKSSSPGSRQKAKSAPGYFVASSILANARQAKHKKCLRKRHRQRPATSQSMQRSSLASASASIGSSDEESVGSKRFAIPMIQIYSLPLSNAENRKRLWKRDDDLAALPSQMSTTVSIPLTRTAVGTTEKGLTLFSDEITAISGSVGSNSVDYQLPKSFPHAKGITRFVSNSDDPERTKEHLVQQGPVQLRNVLEGSHICVYWPMDDVYYDAVVEEREHHQTVKGNDHWLFYIRYQLDNEAEWIDLGKHKFKLMKPRPLPSTDEKKHCRM
mmetsp:Transcript_22510/g.62487  ORF Transcript_22510/g.62487 Transcript_22510/m.62487 type:complete len:707 (-) Transcript_22510:1299-3419(-)